MAQDRGSADRSRSIATYGLVVLGGFAFGAVDQYLGTIHVASRFGWWTITVSGMSAPWLIAPFVVGCTQRNARRAVILGFVVTMSALAGYFFASNSVFEGVPLADAWGRIVAMVTSGANPLWIVGGAATGPVYAYLGYRWRVARSWVAAALVTVALCLEPFARRTVGTAIAGGLTGSRSVWSAEVVVGVVVGCALVIAAGRARAAGRAQPPPQAPAGS